MPKPRKKELIQCQYFRWKLGKRHGVYQADGRTGNQINLGRHSLGTKVINEASDALKALDVRMAYEAGIITKEALQEQRENTDLALVEGWRLYREHVSRPRMTGGAKPVSTKRYRAVFDKLIPFLTTRRVTSWHQVTSQHLNAYCSWLEDSDYAQRTQYLELTTIKQCIRWLVKEGHIPADCKVDITLRKPRGSDTYCWTPEQVNAMVCHCLGDKSLKWLGQVMIALATTGLRISELASLRWSDIANGQVNLADESARARGSSSGPRRETKSGRSRSFPIHPDLQAVLGEVVRGRDGMIFHGPKGGRLKPDTLRNIMIRCVLRPLEKRFPSSPGTIGFKNGRLHSFRHYFCSVCANSGVPELMVKEWLGHADSEMVRHYYHVNQREAQRQMRQLSFVENVGSVVLPMNDWTEAASATERTAS
ncbi:MAG: site-specific integrase [Gemmatales bacterium]